MTFGQNQGAISVRLSKVSGLDCANGGGRPGCTVQNIPQADKSQQEDEWHQQGNDTSLHC